MDHGHHRDNPVKNTINVGILKPPLRNKVSIVYYTG